MTFPPKGGYDPAPKKRRRTLVQWIIGILGLDELQRVAPYIFAPLFWETGQDIIRQLETQILTDSGVTGYKDWMIEDEDACDLCKYYAASGPYEVSVVGPDTHPNCRCYWVPHVE